MSRAKVSPLVQGRKARGECSLAQPPSINDAPRAARSSNLRAASSAVRPTLAPPRGRPPRDRSSDRARKRPPFPEVAVRPAPNAPVRPAAPVQVTQARSGDHPDIHQLLLAIFQGPSRDEFHAVQDDPCYEPSHRLLVKRDQRIVSHVHLTPRTMLFGGEKLPTVTLGWLGTLPEHRGQGHASQLLLHAERSMRASGAALGLLRTTIPHFFHRHGWAVCGRHSCSRVRARTLLARQSAASSQTRLPLNIRLWRHVELPSLLRIYGQNTASAFGPQERSEPYWRWLISRKAFDHIIVAIHGRDRMDLVDTHAPLVGYAVVRQERVLELYASPGYPSTAEQLLARACRDLIERDRQNVILDAPPADPLHGLIVEAGGIYNRREVDEGEVQMVKLLDSARLIEALQPQLAARAAAAALPLPAELGFLVDGRRKLLTLTPQSARLIDSRLGRSYVSLNASEFARLLLGHGDMREAIDRGRIFASTQTAIETARILFPPLPFWRPVWDELPA